MRPAKLDKLLSSLEIQPGEDLDRRIAALITQAAMQSSGTVSPELALWRRIMQSRIAKMAAAIAIVLVGIVAFHIFDSTTSPTWAGVIRPLLTAQTAVFDVAVDCQGVTGEVKLMVMGQRIRYESKSPQRLPITILDYERLQMQYLVPEKKQAILIDLKNLPGEAPENYLESIRDVIEEMQTDPNATIDQLADSVIDGRNAVGFHAKNARGEMTVWADPETLLPVRLEQTYHDLHIVCTDFQFDVELDPALFSMDMPEGYSAASGQLDLGESAEKDLIEGFRIWAQVLEDNQFPQDISMATYMEAMPRVKQKLENGTLQLSTQQKLDMGLKMNRAYQFIMSLKPEQDWHYVGASVPFGDATKPVFWYKPTGSKTYRVVYADLSIRDSLEDDLPK